MGPIYLSGETELNSALFSSFVCMRNEAVKTNCPTVAENPERNALNGYYDYISTWLSTDPYSLFSIDRHMFLPHDPHPKVQYGTHVVASQDTVDEL